MNTRTYTCKTCNKTKKMNSDTKIPICCGQPMVQMSLDICLQPDHSEHARPMDRDDACDDFRSG